MEDVTDDDYDYNNAPEALGWTVYDKDGVHEYPEDDFEYDPYDHFDEDLEIQKSERDYERYIGRS